MLIYTVVVLPKTLKLPICRNHQGLHQQAAASAAVVADMPDMPGNHPEAAVALAAAEAAGRGRPSVVSAGPMCGRRRR